MNTSQIFLIFLSGIYRTLKKDGILIIITPNFTYDYKNFYDDPTHINPFTVIKLSEVLRLFKFREIESGPWVVKKSSFFLENPFKFFICRYMLLTSNESKIPLQIFLKDKLNHYFRLQKNNYSTTK